MALTIIRKSQTEPVVEAPKQETTMLDDLKALDPPVQAAEPEAEVVETPAPESNASPAVTEPGPLAVGVLPWEEQVVQMQGEEQTKDNNIVVALSHLAGQVKKDTLMLIRRATGEPFKVVNHDPQSGQTHLQSQDGRDFKVKVGDRENQFYYPMWR